MIPLAKGNVHDFDRPTPEDQDDWMDGVYRNLDNVFHRACSRDADEEQVLVDQPAAYDNLLEHARTAAKLDILFCRRKSKADASHDADSDSGSCSSDSDIDHIREKYDHAQAKIHLDAHVDVDRLPLESPSRIISIESSSFPAIAPISPLVKGNVHYSDRPIPDQDHWVDAVYRNLDNVFHRAFSWNADEEQVLVDHQSAAYDPATIMDHCLEVDITEDRGPSSGRKARRVHQYSRNLVGVLTSPQ
jgi:hypothetical protein